MQLNEDWNTWIIIPISDDSSSVLPMSNDFSICIETENFSILYSNHASANHDAVLTSSAKHLQFFPSHRHEVAVYATGALMS